MIENITSRFMGFSAETQYSNYLDNKTYDGLNKIDTTGWVPKTFVI